MPDNSPNHDDDQVRNLDDLIEARKERTSALADDFDGMEDVRSTDVDVDAALTFPHPKRDRTAQNIELMDTPREEDVNFDYEDSSEEMLPTEYTSDYNELTTTQLEDEEIVAEEGTEELGELNTEDIIYNTATIDLPEEGGIRGDEPLE